MYACTLPCLKTITSRHIVWLYSTLSEKITSTHTHRTANSKQQAGSWRDATREGRRNKKSTDSICETAPTHHAPWDHQHPSARKSTLGAARSASPIAPPSPPISHHSPQKRSSALGPALPCQYLPQATPSPACGHPHPAAIPPHPAAPPPPPTPLRPTPAPALPHPARSYRAPPAEAAAKGTDSDGSEGSNGGGSERKNAIPTCVGWGRVDGGWNHYSRGCDGDFLTSS